MADSIKKLQDLFSKFPTIGQRTAGRFVFYLLKLPKEKIDEIISAIQEVKTKIRFCSFCFNPHESDGNFCPVCQNPAKDRQLLCVVEKETDLISIEKTKRYNGLYFVLGEVLSLRKNNPEDLRINELKERVGNPKKFGIQSAGFKEIIIALNPTPEGKSTSILVEGALKEISGNAPQFKTTRLARGLPSGGELEYADEETLESAFEGRK